MVPDLILLDLGLPDLDGQDVKAVWVYRQTGNLRAVQLLLGYTKIESTVRYLGSEIDDAMESSEKIDI